MASFPDPNLDLNPNLRRQNETTIHLTNFKPLLGIGLLFLSLTCKTWRKELRVIELHVQRSKYKNIT